ncbi:hypothetical protein [Nocardia sp. NPDC005825]|uniref:hypothetical protein n=1 Tax=Nocardia sp. NPDC005825 TaxID=3155452 RepID=UPI0033FE685F
MRILIAAAAVAGVLSAGVGQAAAAPIPVVDAPAAPVATTGSAGTGSAAIDVVITGVGWALCAVFNPECFKYDNCTPA